jgi:hypothetical protein
VPSPQRIQQEDMKWLLPLRAGAAGLLFMYRKVSEVVSETPNWAGQAISFLRPERGRVLIQSWDC